MCRRDRLRPGGWLAGSDRLLSFRFRLLRIGDTLVVPILMSLESAFRRFSRQTQRPGVRVSREEALGFRQVDFFEPICVASALASRLRGSNVPAQQGDASVMPLTERGLLYEAGSCAVAIACGPADGWPDRIAA